MRSWDWQVFFEDPGGKIPTYWQWMLSAWGWTVSVSVCGLVLALVVGSVIGTIRTLPASPWLVRFGNAWVELFRNIPLLVQMLLWFFVVPELLPRDLALWVKQDMPAKEFVTATLCLGLFTSARIAEQVRAGIESLPRGQREAALALGLSPFQAYRHVLLPRALRTVLAPLTSEFMNTFKNSSVAYAIGLMELTFQARQMQEDSEQGIETYLAVTLLYFLCAFIANRGMAWIERRTRVPGMIG